MCLPAEHNSAQAGLPAERSEAGVNDTADVDNRYKYTGKEFQAEHGLNWYAYGARYYDPMVGRFTGVDPLADKFFYVTPYNYAENEPIANIDLLGLQKLSVKDRIAEAGKKIGIFTAGFINSVSSNAVGGFPGTLRDTNEFGEYAEYAASGQKAGNIFSVGVGTGEVILSAAGVFSESVLAVPTAGATAAAIPATTAFGVHGVTMTLSALKNLLNPTQVNAKGDKKHEQREIGRQQRENQPEAEDFAKWQKKELTKKKGKDAAREAHDSKKKGEPDRSKKELLEDYNN